MNKTSSPIKTILFVLIILCIFVSYLLINSIRETKKTKEKGEKSSVAVKEKKPKRIPFEHKQSMAQAVEQARTKMFKEKGIKDDHKMNRKQMLIRMLAASEGIDKENPTEQDLSPQMQQLVNDPNPNPEKYKHIVERMRQENEKRLETARMNGTLIKDKNRGKEDQYPPYEPHKK